jgi:class 3 adenylate cyclase
MLGSILPSNLVDRIRNGEKNICFQVQSASLVFFDIVEFTPWCGSLPSLTVMSILNALYKKIDELVRKYPTMTKIKIIGDCYEAAGGLFSEVNIPANHATEAVNFAVDCIEAVNAINKHFKQNISIRVGVHTGGPLVAGIVGIGKPTFEIFGSAIEIGHAMESSGVKNAVQITRQVYELVYSDEFIIKEKSQIKVNGSLIQTYLLERR